MAHNEELEITDQEEQEELEITDEEASEEEPEEKPDRGDVVTDPNAEEDQSEEVEDTEETEEEPEAKEEDKPEEDEDAEPQTIPIGRFNEVNIRRKQAEAELLRRDEARLEGQAITEQAGTVPEQESAEQKTTVKELWTKYSQLQEEGSFDEAEEVILQIDEANNARTQEIVAKAIEADRIQREFDREMEEASKTGTELKEKYPELLDSTSDMYKRFTSYADGLHRDLGMRMSAALKEAGELFFGTKTPEVPEVPEVPKEEGNDAAVKRKREAILRNAKAAKQQPAKLDKGVGQGQGTVNASKKITEMTEEEYDALPDKEKDRGDKVV